MKYGLYILSPFVTVVTLTVILGTKWGMSMTGMGRKKLMIFMGFFLFFFVLLGTAMHIGFIKYLFVINSVVFHAPVFMVLYFFYYMGKSSKRKAEIESALPETISGEEDRASAATSTISMVTSEKQFFRLGLLGVILIFIGFWLHLSLLLGVVLAPIGITVSLVLWDRMELENRDSGDKLLFHKNLWLIAAYTIEWLLIINIGFRYWIE